MFAKIAIAAALCAAGLSPVVGDEAKPPQEAVDQALAPAESMPTAFLNAGVWAVAGGGVTRFTARGPHTITNNGPDVIWVQTGPAAGAAVFGQWIGKGRFQTLPAVPGWTVAIKSQGVVGANGTR